MSPCLRPPLFFAEGAQGRCREYERETGYDLQPDELGEGDVFSVAQEEEGEPGDCGKDAEDGFVVAPAKYTQVTVTVKDELPNEPVWWGTTQDMGDYSPVKYRLLNIYLGKVLADLDGYTNITFKAEALRFKNWWKENWASYTYYDADGTTPLYETIPE